MKIVAEVLGPVLGYIFSVVGNYALAIVLFTVLIKLLLMPLTYRQITAMKEMQKIQPELKKLQDKYHNDKETLNIKTMELYKEHKVNPFASCLPLLVQFPILLGMFDALRDPMRFVFSNPAITELGSTAISTQFLWMQNLTVPDTMYNLIQASDFYKTLPGVLPILAAILTFLQTKTMGTTGQSDNPTMRTMNIMMPLMILYFGITMSAGLTLYWVISTLFQIVQQVVMTRLTKEANTL